MKKFFLASLMVLLMISLVLTGCAKKDSDENEGAGQQPKPVKIVAAHNQTSPDNPYQVGLLKFKEVAEEKGVNLDVEVHAGTLGTSESELVEKLSLGAIDVIVVSPGFMTKTAIKEIELFALPYMFESYEHWEKVVDGEVGQKVAQIINDKSNNEFKVLGYWSAGVRHYYGKKPLNSMADLKGMTIRTQTSGVVADFWTQAGAIPTSVAWGELYQALQQNTVDSAENAYPYFVQQNHHKTKNGKYTTETGHDYTTRLLLVNGKKFDSLTQEQRDAIIAAAEASVQAERESVYAQEDEYKQLAISEGAVINEIDRTPFIELAKPIQDRAAEEYGIADMVQQVRDAR